MGNIVGKTTRTTGSDSRREIERMNNEMTLAAGRGEEDKVRRLLQQGADVNAVDEDGWTPLHRACGENVSANDRACDETEDNVVRILLDEGADVNAAGHLGSTPLHIACQHGHTDAVRHLSQQGADVNAVDEFGHTALLWASDAGHSDIVVLLLQNNADVNAVDMEGRTPLHRTCENGNTDIAHLLLQQGADVNAVNEYKETPLHLASQAGSADVVRLLLRRGADVNAVDQLRSTPLHWACLSRIENGAVASMLIDEGANINAVNILGRTPLEVAKMDGRNAAAKVLRSVHGAVQNLSDLCADDDAFDFEQYFLSNHGNNYRLTEKAAEASYELRTSRAYKHYTFEKARKRLRSQKIKIFSDGQVREDGTIFPLASIDIEALVRAFAVDTNLLASQIPGCFPTKPKFHAL